MSTNYRAIMLALLHEQTYAAISARLRCSSKTNRQARSVLDVHGFSVDDVAGLSDGQLEVLFPDHAPVNDHRTEGRNQPPRENTTPRNPLTTHTSSPRATPSAGTPPQRHFPISRTTLSNHRRHAFRPPRYTVLAAAEYC